MNSEKNTDLNFLDPIYCEDYSVDEENDIDTKSTLDFSDPHSDVPEDVGDVDERGLYYYRTKDFTWVLTLYVLTVSIVLISTTSLSFDYLERKYNTTESNYTVVQISYLNDLIRPSMASLNLTDPEVKKNVRERDKRLNVPTFAAVDNITFNEYHKRILYGTEWFYDVDDELIPKEKFDLTQERCMPAWRGGSNFTNLTLDVGLWSVLAKNNIIHSVNFEYYYTNETYKDYEYLGYLTRYYPILDGEDEFSRANRVLTDQNLYIVTWNDITERDPDEYVTCNNTRMNHIWLDTDEEAFESYFSNSSSDIISYDTNENDVRCASDISRTRDKKLCVAVRNTDLYRPVTNVYHRCTSIEILSYLEAQDLNKTALFKVIGPKITDEVNIMSRWVDDLSSLIGVSRRYVIDDLVDLETNVITDIRKYTDYKYLLAYAIGPDLADDADDLLAKMVTKYYVNYTMLTEEFNGTEHNLCNHSNDVVKQAKVLGVVERPDFDTAVSGFSDPMYENLERIAKYRFSVARQSYVGITIFVIGCFMIPYSISDSSKLLSYATVLVPSLVCVVALVVQYNIIYTMSKGLSDPSMGTFFRFLDRGIVFFDTYETVSITRPQVTGATYDCIQRCYENIYEYTHRRAWSQEDDRYFDLGYENYSSIPGIILRDVYALCEHDLDKCKRMDLGFSTYKTCISKCTRVSDIVPEDPNRKVVDYRRLVTIITGNQPVYFSMITLTVVLHYLAPFLFMMRFSPSDHFKNEVSLKSGFAKATGVRMILHILIYAMYCFSLYSYYLTDYKYILISTAGTSMLILFLYSLSIFISNGFIATST